MSRHEVVVARAERGGWDIEVPSAERSHTWARTLHLARQAAAEVVAVWFGLPTDSVSVEVVVAEAEAELNSMRAARAAADAAHAHAEATARAAIVKLAALGLDVGDIAVATGLSRQRAQQLLEEH